MDLGAVAAEVEAREAAQEKARAVDRARAAEVEWAVVVRDPAVNVYVRIAVKPHGMNEEFRAMI
jgi:hypothetical protein